MQSPFEARDELESRNIIEAFGIRIAHHLHHRRIAIPSVDGEGRLGRAFDDGKRQFVHIFFLPSCDSVGTKHTSDVGFSEFGFKFMVGGNP